MFVILLCIRLSIGINEENSSEASATDVDEEERKKRKGKGGGINGCKRQVRSLEISGCMASVGPSRLTVMKLEAAASQLAPHGPFSCPLVARTLLPNFPHLP